MASMLLSPKEQGNHIQQTSPAVCNRTRNSIVP